MGVYWGGDARNTADTLKPEERHGTCFLLRRRRKQIHVTSDQTKGRREKEKLRKERERASTLFGEMTVHSVRLHAANYPFH